MLNGGILVELGSLASWNDDLEKSGGLLGLGHKLCGLKGQGDKELSLVASCLFIL